MRTILIFTLLTCFFILPQCKKDSTSDNPYGLPNATQEGNNIFACRVNGVNWISETGSSNLDGAIKNDTLSAKGKIDDIDVESINILIKGNLVQGRLYQLSANDSIIFSTTRFCNVTSVGFFNYASTKGAVRLTKIDRTNKIIAGTFSFDIIRDYCSNDTLKFTDGRFDIKYF